MEEKKYVDSRGRDIKENFIYSTGHPHIFIDSEGYEKTTSISEIIYTFREDGKWMYEIYFAPERQFLLSRGFAKSLIRPYSSKKELLSQIISNQENLKKRIKSLDTDLEALKQQEDFIKSKI